MSESRACPRCGGTVEHLPGCKYHPDEHVLTWEDRDRDSLIAIVADFFEQGQDVSPELAAAFVAAVKQPQPRKVTEKTIRFQGGHAWAVPIQLRDFILRAVVQGHENEGRSRTWAVEQAAADFELDPSAVWRAITHSQNSTKENAVT